MANVRSGAELREALWSTCSGARTRLEIFIDTSVRHWQSMVIARYLARLQWLKPWRQASLRRASGIGAFLCKSDVWIRNNRHRSRAHRNQSLSRLFRSRYAFMHVLGFDRALYRAEREQLDAIKQKGDGIQILASDISRDAVQIARTNAQAPTSRT